MHKKKIYVQLHSDMVSTQNLQGEKSGSHFCGMPSMKFHFWNVAFFNNLQYWTFKDEIADGKEWYKRSEKLTVWPYYINFLHFTYTGERATHGIWVEKFPDVQDFTWNV